MDKNKIIVQIEKLLRSQGISDINPDLNIFDEGLLSSLFAIELMTYLERCFSIKVTIEDLNMDNFSTVNHICDFVQKKLENERSSPSGAGVTD